MCLCSCMYSLRIFHQTKFALCFQTAGFGGFAGRAFEQDEMVSATWKTLFLPKNFPHSQAVNNYVFAFNETHMGLPLDYGPVFNHHENANVEASKDPRSKNIYFRVRIGFVCASHNVLKICSMHTVHNRYTNT